MPRGLVGSTNTRVNGPAAGQRPLPPLLPPPAGHLNVYNRGLPLPAPMVSPLQARVEVPRRSVWQV